LYLPRALIQAILVNFQLADSFGPAYRLFARFPLEVSQQEPLTLHFDQSGTHSSQSIRLPFVPARRISPEADFSCCGGSEFGL
jgi:hypothetical protein